MKWGVVGAFGAIYLIWGSTYLAIRIAIETLPPFLMVGVRFLTAGALLYLWVRPRNSRPTVNQWGTTGLVGALMLVGGNGMVTWSEQWVASGLAALIVTTVPLWMVLLEWLGGGSRPTGRIFMGLALGFAGVVLLVNPSSAGSDSDHYLLGIGALILAALSWSGGSIYSRRAALPKSPLLSTAMQMIVGGALALSIGLAAGEWASFDYRAISTRSVLALAYLSIFGSIVALSCYVWLLRVSTPARVSTYAFVNPLVAVALGSIFAGEPLTLPMVGAATAILTAVLLITFRSTGEQRSPTPQPAQPPQLAPSTCCSTVNESS